MSTFFLPGYFHLIYGKSKDKTLGLPEATISPDEIRRVSSLPFFSITKDVLLFSKVLAHPALLE